MGDIGWEQKPANGTIKLERHGETTTLAIGEDGRASFMLEDVKRNEPISIIFSSNGEVLSVVDFDCVIRGATRPSVMYVVRQ